jgi:hypothetical protein
MNTAEVAEYIRSHYSREDYLLLTLTSCSLLLSNLEEKMGEWDGTWPKEVEIVTETLSMLRASMDERETLAVAMLMAEIDRLRGEESE